MLNWQKVTEQVATVVLSMVLTAVGSAVAWGVVTILGHERELIMREARIKQLEQDLKDAKGRDTEIVNLMGEEIDDLRGSIRRLWATRNKTREATTEVKPVPEIPDSTKEPKEPKKPIEEFQIKPKGDDYKRILRDKFEQRTQQMAPPEVRKIP
jgi:hypothetical protein